MSAYSNTKSREVPSNEELITEAYQCSHACAEITENMLKGKTGETNNPDYLLTLARGLVCAAQEMSNRSHGSKPKPLAP